MIWFSRFGVLAMCLVGLFLLPLAVQGQQAVIETPGGSANLRAAPSLEATILALLPSGTPLTALRLSVDRQWVYITTDDLQTGWVFRDLTRFTAGESELLLGQTHLPQAVADRVAEIAARGRAFGMESHVFAKVGDSISVSSHWLKPIADGFVDTADYGYLNDVIDYFRRDSFGRSSLATGIGWTTHTVLTPDNATPTECIAHESPLLCEYRILKPAVALIMFGSNDVGILEPHEYTVNMRRILELSIGRGIVPVLSTIPQRVNFEAEVDEYNQIIRDLAAEYRLPLIDYFGAMWTLPAYGLDIDGVHPNVPPRGVEGAVDFHPANLNYGYVIRNLTTLQMLDAVYRLLDPA